MVLHSLSDPHSHSPSMTKSPSSYLLYPINLSKSIDHESYYSEPITSKNLSLSQMSPSKHLYSSKTLLLSVPTQGHTS